MSRIPPGCISILQISDPHILPAPEDTLLGINTEHYFHACLEQAFASNQHFDLVLLTGDLAQHPCKASYQRILNTLEAYKTPSVCLPGNHDDYGLMLRVLNTSRVNCRKQVLFENWQLISLNSQIPGSPGGRLSTEELSFLESCLSSNPDCHALIAVHHHCLESKSIWMDTMMIENSRELFELIDKYPQVKAITCGHIHQVMDIMAKSVRVLGSPSTCFQFVPECTEMSVDNTAPGYRLIQLYADGRIKSEVIRLAEQLSGLQTGTHSY
ncbi:MAG: 3',5'-cyclic-AMP phosphodiesterase [Methylobacter sp.]|jgi:Icc protein